MIGCDHLPERGALRPITFLSDFGLDDEFVAVCKGIIWQILPEANILDITHTIPPYDVRGAALCLARAIQYLPNGVHLVVVDPGVGTQRHSIAVEAADGRLFVGPDNGVLSAAVQVCGGAIAATVIDPTRWGMTEISATFHGRDVFAPAAAVLAGGVGLSEVGDAIDPAELLPLLLPLCQVAEDGTIVGQVLSIDRYGNCATNVSEFDLSEAGVAVGDKLSVICRQRRETVPFVRTFGDVQERELLTHIDSAGQLAVALASGNAAETLGLAIGDPITIEVERPP